MAVPFVIFEVEQKNADPLIYNTYRKWGLIPTGRLVVSPAGLQEKYVDIPGMNGSMDITEILTGGPLFKNRTGSWDFYVVPYGYAFIDDQDLIDQRTGQVHYDTTIADDGVPYDGAHPMINKTPAQMCQMIYSKIHGKKLKVILYNDITSNSQNTIRYVYEGRVMVKSWPPGKTYSKITIDYNLAPGRIKETLSAGGAITGREEEL